MHISQLSILLHLLKSVRCSLYGGLALCIAADLYRFQVYYQLENLSQADPPYKSVAALNCVILGCANIWDIDRAYQTFAAIESSFGLVPDIHSYNALIYAFAKLGKVNRNECEI